jgi:hypothetical protein
MHHVIGGGLYRPPPIGDKKILLGCQIFDVGPAGSG